VLIRMALPKGKREAAERELVSIPGVVELRHVAANPKEVMFRITLAPDCGGALEDIREAASRHSQIFSITAENNNPAG
jgi:hypothetical protein